jgi:predicted phage-related endonuclease
MSKELIEVTLVLKEKCAVSSSSEMWATRIKEVPFPPNVDSSNFPRQLLAMQIAAVESNKHTALHAYIFLFVYAIQFRTKLRFKNFFTYPVAEVLRATPPY